MKRLLFISVLMVLILGTNFIITNCSNPLGTSDLPIPNPEKPLIDTIIIYDTVMTIDTFYISDTVFVVDSTIYYDTITVIDTVVNTDTVIVFDSTTFVDTVLVFDFRVPRTARHVPVLTR